MNCTKARYSKREAQTVVNERASRGTPGLRIYHCSNCNGWHITHAELRAEPVYSEQLDAVLLRLVEACK